MSTSASDQLSYPYPKKIDDGRVPLLMWCFDEREGSGWSGREERGWTHDRSGDMPLSELRI